MTWIASLIDIRDADAKQSRPAPNSGHATRQSLEIYSRPALAGAQQRYDDVIGDFPV